MDHMIQKPGQYELLIVDDSPDSLKILSRMLQERGYRVRPTTNGRHALKSAAARLPDLVLLDVKMPDMDGHEVCRRLKANEHSRNVPVIFINAYGESAEKVHGFKAGGVDYITKPFEAEEVLARVEIHLQLHELTVQLEQKIAEQTEELHAANARLQSELAERKKADALLRGSEEEYRGLIQRIRAAVVVHGADTRILVSNPQAQKLLGLTEEQMMEKSVIDPDWHFFREDGTVMTQEDYPVNRVLATGRPLRDVVAGVHRSSTTDDVWVLVNADPLLNEQGQITQVIVTFVDITAHRKAQADQHRLNRQLRAISTCNQVLMQASDEQTLLDDVCRIVCEVAGYRMAWVGYPQNDDARTVRPVAWAGVEEDYLTETEITWADTERGQGPTGRAIREGVSACIQDFVSDPHAAPWRESAIQRGYRSSSALPLKEKGTTPFGALCIYSTEPNTFTPEENRLLEELAGNLAFGIKTLRMREEHKKAERQLLASEQLFRALVENSPDFIARYDREFRRIYVNPAIQKLFGDKAQEVLGYSPADQSPLYAPQVYIDHIRQAIETATESTAEIPFRTAQGEMHWGHIRFVPEFGPDGNVLSVLAIGRDIHEIKENEQRFRMLAENFPDFTVRFDRDGHFSYVNPAFEKAFGMPADAIVGKTLHELPQRSESEQNDAHLELIRQAFDKGVAKESEARWDTELGERIFEIRHVPEKDAAGNVVSVLAIARDITERRRNEAVNISRLRLIQFAETHSLDELLEETLNEVEKLTGSLISFYHFVEDDQKSLTLQNWSTRTKAEFCKAEGKGLHYTVGEAGVWVECVYQRKPVIHNDYASLPHRKGMPEGHAEVIRELVVPVLRGEMIEAILGIGNKPSNYNEKDVEIVSLMADLAWEIAERKRAEEEIRRINQELEQRVHDRTAQLEAANKDLQAFAYTVSHDLRSPLRHIDGFLGLLQKKAGTALDKQSRHYMDSISEAAQKMGLLIDDLLSFSRMGRHAISFQQVALTALVHDIINELEPDTTGRKIDWRIGDLPVVEGDAAMLRMVLINLISNALKFTRPRQQARIEIGSLPDQVSEVVIYVRDNGVGFDMTYMDKLFDVFQRLHRADEFEGTGIGLANVRRIINRHGGRTWAEGEPNQGAAFYFALPIPVTEGGDGKP